MKQTRCLQIQSKKKYSETQNKTNRKLKLESFYCSRKWHVGNTEGRLQSTRRTQSLPSVSVSNFSCSSRRRETRTQIPHVPPSSTSVNRNTTTQPDFVSNADGSRVLHHYNAKEPCWHYKIYHDRDNELCCQYRWISFQGY